MNEYTWAANENARQYRRALELLDRAAARACHRGELEDMSAYNIAIVAVKNELAASRAHIAKICVPWFEAPAAIPPAPSAEMAAR